MGGATFSQNTSTYVTTCTTDADCYTAATTLTAGNYAAATTDAEKAKRCCLSMGYTTEPTGTDLSVGIFSINLDMAYISYMATNWGMP